MVSPETPVHRKNEYQKSEAEEPKNRKDKFYTPAYYLTYEKDHRDILWYSTFYLCQHFK